MKSSSYKAPHSVSCCYFLFVSSLTCVRYYQHTRRVAQLSRKLNRPEATVKVCPSFATMFSLRAERRGSSRQLRLLAEYQLGLLHPHPVRLPSCSPYKSITPPARTTRGKIKLAPTPPTPGCLPATSYT